MKFLGPIPTLAAFLSWCAFSLMIGVGILHSVGLCSTTIGYDTAMGLVLCFVTPVLFLFGSVMISITGKDKS
jgi:uncharacterized membrane protein YiaA